MSKDILPIQYILNLSLRHPTEDIGRLSEIFQLNPNHTWKFGDECRTPKGNKFPGSRQFSYWNYSLVQTEGRNISDDLRSLIAILTRNEAEMRKFTENGGEIWITFNLNGDLNTGFIIDRADLSQAHSLSLNFGFEVFPDMH